MLSKVASEN